MNNIYTSIACNRTTNCIDWGINGLIAFGANNSVGIIDPQYNKYSSKILRTYVEHKTRVNTVEWIRGDCDSHLLSGGNDGLAVFWNLQNIPIDPKRYPFKAHTAGIYTVSGIKLADAKFLIGTAAADKELKLWVFDGENASCVQTLRLNDGFCFNLRLSRIPNSENVILAYSSDDGSIRLWAQHLETQELFTFIHKLTGHEDWVRGLDFVADGNDLLLASCAQDHFIRLWRISPRAEEQLLTNKVNNLQINNDLVGEIRAEERIVQISPKAWCAISLESVLFGHEGWVYSVQWHKSEKHGLRLLSASIDKSLIVWQCNPDGVWLEKARLGEIGGNSLGFLGAKFNSEGNFIIGYSYHGAFHLWQLLSDNHVQWKPRVIVSGHYSQVRDLDWERNGRYLMTVSADQTTRIHAPWILNEGDSEENTTWHELARPQLHGYDMQTLATLTSNKFASGAEEKIVRAFEAPAIFINHFKEVCKYNELSTTAKACPQGASVPSLGLSNKAVYEVEEPEISENKSRIEQQYPENYFVPVKLSEPPHEETLMQNTLWPEVQKLYGHGYEIYALASSPDGKLLASSCRSTNEINAQIRLWNTDDWTQVQTLGSHTLTVTQMSFSPDGQYLLSVSRDRRWSLFERQQVDPVAYQLTATTDKTNGVHTRIIWSCDWSPDSKFFATSSRDGKVAIWTKANRTKSIESTINGWQAATRLELKNESITAVAYAKQKPNNDAYILAVGFETGHIRIYKVNIDSWTMLFHLERGTAHHMTVTRLRFRPSIDKLQLASCGNDHLVKITELHLEK